MSAVNALEAVFALFGTRCSFAVEADGVVANFAAINGKPLANISRPWNSDWNSAILSAAGLCDVTACEGATALIQSSSVTYLRFPDSSAYMHAAAPVPPCSTSSMRATSCSLMREVDGIM